MSRFEAAYAAWLAFVALQRAFELALTRARLRSSHRSRSTPSSDSLGAHSHSAHSHSADTHSADSNSADTPWTWRAMVTLHAGLIVLPACEVFLFGSRPPAALFVVAIGAFLAAQVLRYWAIHSAGPAWNARAVVAPSMTVSTRGPYRFVRHPNYLAVIVEFSAIPLGGGAWISWIVLNLAHAPVLAARIRGEERLLARLPEWNERMAAKGRFWPRRTRS